MAVLVSRTQNPNQANLNDFALAERYQPKAYLLRFACFHIDKDPCLNCELMFACDVGWSWAGQLG